MSCACFFTAPSSFFFIMYFLIPSVAYFPLPCASNPGRRILHQPFFPLDSPPPSQPPSPSPPTPTPPDTPFFPTYPSPPPPPSSPAALASFPANASSLNFPQSPKPHSSSSKLLAVTAAAAISAVIVIGIVVFYYFRRRFQNRKVSDDDKEYKSSDNNNRRFSTNADTRSSPKLRTTSMSSEFLYLGTVVDSTGINNSSNVAADHQKMESPELRPLLPLNKQGSRQNGGNGRAGITTGDDDWYSARVSLDGQDNSIGPGSGRVFVDVAGADYGRKSIDSTSCSSSCSSSSKGSPSRSISISPPVSLSPHLKSPETVAAEGPAPPPPRPPPPPPPPPPQRPPWESPAEATPTVQPMGKPPSLIPPSRAFALQSTSQISPVELTPSSKAMENLEETPKPKLKPLHWDKVRASSDRETVWDQLRSSSFK